jgi:hypothetical protein
MPCTLCRLTLTIPPCEHPTGLIGGYEFETLLIDEGAGWFKASDIHHYLVGYTELHHKCPCKECLIKTVCHKNSVNDADICTTYREFINSVVGDLNAVSSV